ncbi:GGDEF domain-containing protein [Enterococcus casseliflavus]|uniref:GGDEF domain-containing protein n=1 Tax=Enterococcus casseliflavus TaxID=37734 RepID=UPI003A4C5EC2
MIIRLFIVMGLLFCNYMIFMGVTQSPVFETKSSLKRIIWILIIINSLLILQGVPGFSYIIQNYAYGIVVQNIDLQMVILFYSLYLFREKWVIYFNVFLGSIITFYYMYQGEYHTTQDYIISIAIIGGIFLSCYLVLVLEDRALTDVSTFFLSIFLFGSTWGFKMNPSLKFDFPTYIVFLLNFLFLMIIVRLVNRLVYKQFAKINELSNQVQIDFLTGIKNRLTFEQEFKKRFDSPNLKNSLVLAIVDIDHFKRINDNYGHDTGDRILKSVAQIIEETLFQYQLENQVFRIGGEEFGLLFQEEQHHDILDILKVISKKIKNFSFIIEGEEIRVTISTGVSHYNITDHSKKDLYKRADECLYIAKRAGRNAIFMDGKINYIT